MTFGFFKRQALTEHAAIVDAMRGLAAVLVLLSHADAYGLVPIPWDPVWKGLVGEAGVDLFFILSGYLIWISAEHTIPQGVGAYAVHRFTRVAPLYYFNLLFVVLMAPFFVTGYQPEVTSDTIVRHIFFTQSLEPNVSRDLNPVLWTLTHEALFYALVPVLWLVRRVLWLLLPLAVLAYFGSREHWFWIFDPFAKVFALFAIGFVLARLKLTPSWTLFVLALVAFAATEYYEQRQFVRAAAFAFALFTGMSCLTQLGPLMARGLTPLSWIGLISYSLYIWHYLIIELLAVPIRRVFDEPITCIPAFLAITFGLSWLSYRFIERPSMTTLRAIMLRWIGAKPKPAEASS